MWNAWSGSSDFWRLTISTQALDRLRAGAGRSYFSWFLALSGIQFQFSYQEPGLSLYHHTDPKTAPPNLHFFWGYVPHHTPPNCCGFLPSFDIWNFPLFAFELGMYSRFVLKQLAWHSFIFGYFLAQSAIDFKLLLTLKTYYNLASSLLCHWKCFYLLDPVDITQCL